MKNSILIAITLMSILSLFGCGRAKAPEYPSDQLTTRDGTQFTISFYKHASLSIAVGGKYIYVDPVSANADYAALPKADIVLITHSLAVAELICDNVVVIDEGKIVEEGKTEDIFANPQSDVARKLLEKRL